jgi:hypothetical protein
LKKKRLIRRGGAWVGVFEHWHGHVEINYHAMPVITDPSVRPSHLGL